MKAIKFLFLIPVVFLISCSVNNPTYDPTITPTHNATSITPTTVNDVEPDYPYPPPVQQIITPGYPAPSTPEPMEILVVPTPASDTGVLTGYIINRLEDGTEVPYSPRILALGEIISIEGQPLAASLSSLSLKTVTDSKGRFVFEQVAPGQYVLIVDNLLEAFMLNHPVTKGDFMIEVSLNQITDLGVLIFDQLP